MSPITVQRDVRIPTPNPDVSLSADIYLPSTAAPAPALITLLPYRKDLMTLSLDRTMRWFAERRYACLLIELRGVGASDGVPRPKNHADEGDDAVAAIEWAAAQRWCTGKVGVWGHSAGGVTALRAAVRRPTALAGVIAIECPLDVERDAVHHDGARGDLHQLALWGGLMVTQQLLPPLEGHTSVVGRRRWRERLATEPLALDLAAHGPGSAAWKDRTIEAEAIRTPALFIAGWRDPYARAMTDAFTRAAGPSKLLVGPWFHTMPHESPFEPVDFHAVALRWWDHWLRGADNGVMEEPPVTVYALGHEPSWLQFGTWPPPGDELRLDHGTAGTYRPDPTAGALSGLWGIPVGAFGLPLDQHDDDARSVCATSDAFDAPLLLAGSPRARVRLEAEGQTPERLVVRLAEVDADGRSTHITTGVLCPEGPGVEHTILLRPTCYAIRPGSRLRVVVGDADFPRLRPLAAPAAFRVMGIELRCSTVAPDGSEAPPPLLGEPPASPTPNEARWVITRDPVADEVSVAIETSGGAVTTRDGHLLDRRSELGARVRRAAPEAAAFTGDHRMSAVLSTGERITATATVRCTNECMWLRGILAVDGTTVFSRTWEVALHG